MRVGTLASPVAATAAAGAFTTYVIASTLILAYVILGVFLRPPAALHATPSALIVTPASLDFGKVAAGHKIVLTEMVKTNSGSQLQWKAVSGNAGWLNIMLSNTIEEPDNFREVIYDITADTSNLRDGQQYSVIFTISSDGAKKQQVLIKIQVVSLPSPAKLNINPLLLDFGTQNMSSQGIQFLSVSNRGQTDLAWSANRGNTPWLTLNPGQGKIVSGGLPEIIQVKVNTATLTPGQHSASINFTSNGGNASVSVVIVVAVGSTPTLRAPIVSSISPNSGSTPGGTNVTITGSGLLNTSEVLFGSIAVSNFTIESDTQISAVSPPGSGTVDVTVLTPNGTSATSSADQFTYSCPFESDYSTPPTVTNVNPSTGSTSGGTTVIITGTCFYGGAYGVYRVFFGSTDAIKFTVNSDSQITAVSPAGSGTVDVTVVTTNATSAISTADQFTYNVPIIPMVTNISPNSGPTSGGTSVTITGSGFTGATSVSFGGFAAKNFTFVSDSQINVISPAGGYCAFPCITVDVTVTTSGGTSVHNAADRFTYIYPPSVSSIGPYNGPTTGGTSVTITGYDFINVTAVSFGSTIASSVTIDSGTQITALSPPGSGIVDVTVTTPGGTSTTSADDQFTYLLPPSVTGISPTNGPNTGGTTVIITGSNFSQAKGVSFGGTAATNVIINSDSQITVTSPAAVCKQPCTSDITVDVTITTPGGTSATTTADQFIYYPPNQ